MVLATDGLQLVGEVLGHLRGQTVAERIEVILVTPPGSIEGDLSAEKGRLHSMRAVEAATRDSPPGARAVGVLNARAPVVAFSETHCFPDPDWAEALLRAHAGPWGAVAPEINNENPGRATSWANIFIDYSPWLAPIESGRVNDLPGHNSSYKRALLLEYGDRLPTLFESESVMHWDLRDRGHGLYQEADAKVHHRNITEPKSSILEHFHNGRCFSALRSHDWSAPRRAIWALGSPLIPLVRFSRIVREARRPGRRLPLKALPIMIMSLAAHGIGEMIGYATGSGESVTSMAVYELERDEYSKA